MTTLAVPYRVTGELVSSRSATEVEAAVQEVYRAHYGRLAGWATHLVGDRDLAHDFATEAFVRLLGHWSTVEEPRPWLYTTVGNLVRDHWRKRGRESAAYERLQVGVVDPDVAAPGPDLADVLTVREAVESLPERLRMAVLLHYFGDLTVVQVAHQLGKSEGTIKRDLFDARKLLAKTLEGVR